jgi:hypothetical protein
MYLCLAGCDIIDGRQPTSHVTAWLRQTIQHICVEAIFKCGSTRVTPAVIQSMYPDSLESFYIYRTIAMSPDGGEDHCGT